MSIASSSLDLIRRVFRRDQMIVPGAPDIYNTMDFTSNQSLGGMQLSANGPQSEGSGYLSESVAVDQDLTSRYQDYEEMDSYPEIAAALDIFADDATVQDTLNGRSLWFEAPDNVIQEILENMVTKQLRLEDGLWERARTIAKWGNCFEEIICIDQVGVVDLKDLPVPTCRRIQDPHGLLYGFVQDPSLGFTVSTEMFLQRIQAKSSVSNYLDQSGMHSYDDLVQVFEPWELVHYRMQGRNSSDAYGISMADASRYAWRRLTMMEDSMILYKITRSPSRFAFYCDVGDAPPNQVKKLLNQVKQDFRKQRYTDASGKLLTRFNPLCLSLETGIPVISGGTKKLKDIINDFEKGIKTLVYSIDPSNEKIVPGHVSWAGVTRKNAQVVRVTLDNCRSEVVTPDHKFMLRTGEYREAQDLKPGDSLMPFNRGITAQGYEYVAHPGNDSWDTIEPTHRIVAKEKQAIPFGYQVHHIDENKRNNHPDNLMVMSKQEHARMHGHFKIWNRTEEHSIQASENNRKYGKGKNIVDYNNSPQHTKDNVIRSKAMSDYRARAGDEHNKLLRIKFTDSLRSWLVDSIRINPSISIERLTNLFQQAGGEVLEEFRAANTRPLKNIHRHMILDAIRGYGFKDYADFKKEALYNHKVISVERIEAFEDTGCITVDGWHNFAVDSGVFVKNSADEDFFLPVRKGNKGTEVEVLAGPEGQQIDDVNYFKDKLIASLKMPKSYLGADDTVGRANLSQLDIRLCRTVMRLQRVIKNGMMQVARVDLSAKNIDPDLVEFSCYMNIPSGALELAQLEVLNAKLDLADKYQRANFPEYYVWSAVLGLSDDEISMYKSIRDQERGAGGATESKIGVYSTEKMIDEAKKDQRAQEQIKRVLDEVALGRSDFSRRMKELKGLVSDVRYSVSRDIKSRRKK
jgi:hypothetical protein